jgi:L-2,4-diaminobutyric acid acetyltransferase
MNDDSEIETSNPFFREPEKKDSPEIYSLVKNTPPLDLNSEYHYMIQCTYFRKHCIVVELQSRIAGFISAYIDPQRDKVLFIWQVAIHEDFRGKGLASAMILKLLNRECHKKIQFIETTVTPSNGASAALFNSLTQKLETQCITTDLYESDLFVNPGHETEVLYVIGPYNPVRGI